jgi:hypothetical protein
MLQSLSRQVLSCQSLSGERDVQRVQAVRSNRTEAIPLQPGNRDHVALLNRPPVAVRRARLSRPRRRADRGLHANEVQLLDQRERASTPTRSQIADHHAQERVGIEWSYFEAAHASWPTCALQGHSRDTSALYTRMVQIGEHCVLLHDTNGPCKRTCSSCNLTELVRGRRQNPTESRVPHGFLRHATARRERDVPELRVLRQALARSIHGIAPLLMSPASAVVSRASTRLVATCRTHSAAFWLAGVAESARLLGAMARTPATVIKCRPPDARGVLSLSAFATESRSG